MKVQRDVRFLDTIRALAMQEFCTRSRTSLCRPLPATPRSSRPERTATAEGKIDRGGTRRVEKPVCTRFGPAQRGQISAPRSRAMPRLCWLGRVPATPGCAALRWSAIHG
jgi:hypothetical protein